MRRRSTPSASVKEGKSTNKKHAYKIKVYTWGARPDEPVFLHSEMTAALRPVSVALHAGAFRVSVLRAVLLTGVQHRCAPCPPGPVTAVLFSASVT